MKFPNLHIVYKAGKNLALLDTLSRKTTPPELLTKKQLLKNHKILISISLKMKLHQD